MKTNQLKSGVILSYLSMGLGVIISMIYTPIMLRLLGQSEYGIYQIAYSVISYLNLFSLGFGSAYMRFYSQSKAKNDETGIAKLNGMFLIVFIVLGFLAIIAGSALVINVETIFEGGLKSSEIDTARVLMVFMIFNLALSFPGSVFNSYITAHECFLFQRIVTLVVSIFNPMLSLILLLMGMKSVALVVATTVITVGNLLINIWYCLKKINMQFCFRNLEFKKLKEISVFSLFLFLNMITDQINWSVDKFILGKVTGSVGTAIYAVGSQINSYYMQLSTTVSTVFIPRVNNLVAKSNDNNELTNLFIKVGRIQFIILSFILGGFIILGEFFIKIWAGPDYNLSYYIALLLITPVTIPLIQNIGIEIQRAKNMHKFRSVVYFFIAIFNVILSIPLSIKYGAMGAAIGTAISLIVGNGILMNWYYQTKVGLDIFLFWKQILKLVPACAISGIVAFIFKQFIGVNNFGTFIAIGIIYIFTFCIVMWNFGINSYEKNLIYGPLNKILKRRK